MSRPIYRSYVEGVTVRAQAAPEREPAPALLFPCDCTNYNGGQCYNCLNGAHSICEQKPKCNKAAPETRTAAAQWGQMAGDAIESLQGDVDALNAELARVKTSEARLLAALKPFAAMVSEIPTNRKQLGTLTDEQLIEAANAVAAAEKEAAQ